MKTYGTHIGPHRRNCVAAAELHAGATARNRGAGVALTRDTVRQDQINQSSRMLVQRRALETMFSNTVQRRDDWPPVMGLVKTPSPIQRATDAALGASLARYDWAHLQPWIDTGMQLVQRSWSHITWGMLAAFTQLLVFFLLECQQNASIRVQAAGRVTACLLSSLAAYDALQEDDRETFLDHLLKALASLSKLVSIVDSGAEEVADLLDRLSDQLPGLVAEMEPGAAADAPEVTPDSPGSPSEPHDDCESQERADRRAAQWPWFASQPEVKWPPPRNNPCRPRRG